MTNDVEAARPDFISEAAAIVARLRDLDRRRVVFGAAQHGYGFAAPLSLEAVERFEHVHGLRLPPPYRRFITELGNGGAGPYYGIRPLDLDAAHLRQAFPSAQAFALDSDDPAWDDDIAGAQVIAEFGCGVYFLLVLNGPGVGEVWVDARYEAGIMPVRDDIEPRWGFDTWWLSEMRSHLARFEQIRAMMLAGTAHEAIHAALEPGVLQLEVDQTMLSIMDQDPRATPTASVQKPWGRVCGLVEDHYAGWLRGHLGARSAAPATGAGEGAAR